MSFFWGRSFCHAVARVAAIAVVAGLSGCATPQDDAGPVAVGLPGRYEAAGKTVATSPSRWWTRFGSAELDRLMAAADAGNIDIAAAVAQLKQAEAQAQIAQASLWPSIGLSDNAARSRSSGTMAPGVIARTHGANSFALAISASYTVDLWGQNRDLLEAAIRNASSSAYQVEVVRVAMQAAVVNAYLTLAANRERARVAQANIASAERILRVYQLRKTAGTGSDLEIAQQTTLLENLRAALPPLRQASEQARITLALLMGKPAQAAHPAVHGILHLRAPAISPGLPSALLVRRPDIWAAEDRLRAADADVSAARKALLPTITLTGQGGLQSRSLSNLLRPESVIYSIAAGLAQPIFDGGRIRAQIALSEAERQALLEAYRKSIITALTDVESALVAVRETAAREAGVQRAVASARQAFALSEDRLKAGTIDLATLLTAQQSLFQAQDSVVQARLARLQATATLMLALGGDWSLATGRMEAEKLREQTSHIPALPLPLDVVQPQ